jgi:hypothetical protein
MLGLLARSTGVTQAELARGVSKDHVRAYLRGRRDVSDGAARRMWRAFVKRVMCIDDPDASALVAVRLGSMLHERARMYEGIATNIGAFAEPCGDSAEARLPWIWLGAIELAFACAMLAHDDIRNVRSAFQNGPQQFGKWLRAECERLQIHPSPSALASQLYSLSTERARHEQARRCIQRYFDGATPASPAHQVHLVHLLAGSRSIDQPAIAIGVRVARAVHTARVLKSIEEVAPGYCRDVASNWQILCCALVDWANEKALEPMARMHLALGPSFSEERGKALKATAPAISDKVFGRLTLAYAGGTQATINHLDRSISMLRVATHRFGTGESSRPVRHAALLGLNPAEFRYGYAAAVAEGMREVIPAAYFDGMAALEQRNYHAAVHLFTSVIERPSPLVGAPIFLAFAHIANGDSNLAATALDEFLTRDLPIHIQSALLAPVLKVMAALGRPTQPFLEQACNAIRRSHHATPCGAFILLARERFAAGDALGALDAYLEYVVGAPGCSTQTAKVISRNAQRTLPGACLDQAVAAAHEAAAGAGEERRRYETIEAMLRRME